MRININTRILYTFILVFLTCLPYTLHCFPRYFYKQLSLNEGLSQTTVTCILKDHKGVIWIGTQMGLNRFDQYELKNYFIDANNAYSLPDNNIVFIAEDAELNLWIATQTGLVMYDRGKDQFIPQQCYHDIVAKSYTLVDDGIVFGGAALWKYSYNDHTISLLDVSKDNEIKDYVTYIRKWRDDLFIAGTRWNGVYLYDNKTQKIDPFTACNEAQISAYLIDDRNNLWLSPYGKGLV